MKYFNTLWLCAVALFMMASCAEDSKLDFSVSQPDSLAQVEFLKDYDVLKSYVDRTANPSFKLGAGVSVADFTAKTRGYSLIVTNFDEVTAGSEMKHGAIVQEDGSLNLNTVKGFITAAQDASISIFGNTLMWHANQNAIYLNKTIAPLNLPSDGTPAWGTLTANDFETASKTNYSGNTNAIMDFTADGEGYNGVGRALKITNTAVRANDWECQLFVTFAPVTKVGERYILTMDIRSDVAATYPTQAQTNPGAYKHWDFFGQLSSPTTWFHFSKEITITSNTVDCNTIAFNLGKTATTFYFDNMKVEKFYPNGVAQTVERTPEEKKTILSAELDRWVAGIMGEAKNYVKAWDVVTEPMDDAKPYELKSGIGKTKATGEFYWQDYLGKDYAVQAFKLAAQYGNSGDKLFINDTKLESNIDKCKGLIDYVEYIESQGGRVDGIGTQLDISTTSDKAKIEEMFTLLAQTGKLINISKLNVNIDSKKTNQCKDADYQAQAEMYKFVVQKYLELIPAAQRYGITIWSPLDSKSDPLVFRPSEPIGLWTLEYNRKRAFGGVADALGGN
jgi:GH35 family endo-1,4-beta-xylanase